MPGLSERERELVTISVLLTLGREREARTHLHGALNVGITKDELVEVLMQLGVYAGFPATMTGADLIAEVLQARGELRSRTRVAGLNTISGSAWTQR